MLLWQLRQVRLQLPTGVVTSESVPTKLLWCSGSRQQLELELELPLRNGGGTHILPSTMSLFASSPERFSTLIFSRKPSYTPGPSATKHWDGMVAKGCLCNNSNIMECILLNQQLLVVYGPSSKSTKESGTTEAGKERLREQCCFYYLTKLHSNHKNPRLRFEPI